MHSSMIQFNRNTVRVCGAVSFAIPTGIVTAVRVDDTSMIDVVSNTLRSSDCTSSSLVLVMLSLSDVILYGSLASRGERDGNPSIGASWDIKADFTQVVAVQRYVVRALEEKGLRDASDQRGTKGVNVDKDFRTEEWRELTECLRVNELGVVEVLPPDHSQCIAPPHQSQTSGRQLQPPLWHVRCCVKGIKLPKRLDEKYILPRRIRGVQVKLYLSTAFKLGPNWRRVIVDISKQHPGRPLEAHECKRFQKKDNYNCE